MPAALAVVNYVRETAAKYGIEPDVAVGVMNHEGTPNQNNWIGDHGTSFGPFQLHYNVGLGDEYTAETGLHASDFSTWQQQIDWALRYASQNGWGKWNGAAAAGYSRWTGINRGGSSGGNGGGNGGGSGADSGGGTAAIGGCLLTLIEWTLIFWWILMHG